MLKSEDLLHWQTEEQNVTQCWALVPCYSLTGMAQEKVGKWCHVFSPEINREWKHMVITHMRGSRTFCQGSPGPTARKQPGEFLVLKLFSSLQGGSNGFITEKTNLFQGSRRGPNFFQRGPNANFYRNPYNLWEGGGSPHDTSLQIRVHILR